MKSKWKKILACMAACVIGVGTLAFAACGGEKDINVIMREASSGTREAFDKYVGLTEDNMIKNLGTYSSTGAVKTAVQNNKTAIGYISLASTDDTVKTLTVEGVEATHDNVRNGQYPVQRDFLLLTKTGTDLTPAAQDFFNFCMSVDAKEALESKGGITTSNFESRSEYTPLSAPVSGAVTVSGSTSMEDVIKALIAEYQKINGENVEGVDFSSMAFEGSGAGREAVSSANNNGTVIGLASSSSPNSAYTEHTLCLDAVAVIVNKSNETISDITKQQLFDIFTGKVKKFSELAAK